MPVMFLCRNNAVSSSPLLQNSIKSPPFTCLFPYTFTSAIKNPPLFLSASSRFRLNCRYKDDVPLSTSLAYDVLGVNPNCTPDELKSAFRSKVKQFHPDVTQDKGSSGIMIRRVIKAYEVYG